MNVATFVSRLPYPAYIRGGGLITTAIIESVDYLLPEAEAVIAAAGNPVDPATAYWINAAIVRLKSRGLTPAQMAPRIAELIRWISPGWVRWSDFNINPANVDNSAQLNALPAGVLVIGDTPGTIKTKTQWFWQSGTHLLLDPSMVVTCIANNLLNAQGFITNANLAAPITDVGAYGLAVARPNNTFLARMFTIYANTFRLIDWSAAHYNSLMGLQGSDQEIAYGSATDGFPTSGHPGLRHLGNSPKVASSLAANVWVHDCYVEAGDGVYQISGTNGGLTPNVDADDYLFEDVTGLGFDSPMILVGTGSITRNPNAPPFSSAITNFVFRRIAGATSLSTILLDHFNNLKTVSGGLIQDCTLDGSSQESLPGAIRILGNIHNVTLQRVDLTAPVRGAVQIAGPGNQGIVFDSCFFDAPSELPGVSPAVTFQVKNSVGVTLQNSTINQNPAGNITVQIGPKQQGTGDFTASTTVITNNQIQAAAAKFAILLEDLDQGTVTGNVLATAPGATGGRGISLMAAAAPDTGTTNTTVQFNDLSGIDGTKVNCAPGQGNTVTNNIGATDCPP